MRKFCLLCFNILLCGDQRELDLQPRELSVSAQKTTIDIKTPEATITVELASKKILTSLESIESQLSQTKLNLAALNETIKSYTIKSYTIKNYILSNLTDLISMAQLIFPPDRSGGSKSEQVKSLQCFISLVYGLTSLAFMTLRLPLLIIAPLWLAIGIFQIHYFICYILMALKDVSSKEFTYHLCCSLAKESVQIVEMSIAKLTLLASVFTIAFITACALGWNSTALIAHVCIFGALRLALYNEDSVMAVYDCRTSLPCCKVVNSRTADTNFSTRWNKEFKDFAIFVFIIMCIAVFGFLPPLHQLEPLAHISAPYIHHVVNLLISYIANPFIIYVLNNAIYVGSSFIVPYVLPVLSFATRVMTLAPHLIILEEIRTAYYKPIYEAVRIIVFI